MGSTSEKPKPRGRAYNKHVDKRSDVLAIVEIGEILNEFYPDVRKAILEYCLFITEKDLQG